VVYGETFSHDVADLDRPTKGLQYRYAIRDGWKLIAPRDPSRGAELYDLDADPFEAVDLAGAQPQKAASLQRALDAWWQVDRGAALQTASRRRAPAPAARARR